MAAIADTQTQRQNGYQSASGYGNGNNIYNNGYSGRNHNGGGYGMHHNHSDLDSIAHGFQGMNVGTQPYSAHAKSTMMGAAGGHYNNVPTTNGMYANSQYVYPNVYNASAATQSAGMYTPQASHFMPQMGYSGYQQHDHSPLSNNWTPTTAGATGEVPTLITPRRGSVSSNENDQPATPNYAGYPGFVNGGVAINRSPSGVFSHSTPSPSSMMGPYGIAVGKQLEQSHFSPRLKMLLAQDPAIPRAIPAPSSPLKPLDRALENQRGETNVYIRGLLPETTDELIDAWGSRFGDIKSSKSIIDLNTGLCKGFGFVKYHNYEDAENCIRGFHYLGYEVSFARESFYSKLKTFQDESNTNLYVSNLPKSMNEHELGNLFAPHKVCSAKILRDKNGHGRGVGFARFESRDACEEVIRAFNNYTIDSSGEELQIQIRYADTQEQKSLKQQTQAARQFRSAEYEYATQAWRQGKIPYAGTTLQDTAGNNNEFEQYLGTNTAAPFHAQRWTQSAARQLPGRSPLAGRPYNGATQPQTPVTAAHAGAGTDGHATVKREDSPTDVKPVVTSPAAGKTATGTSDAETGAK